MAHSIARGLAEAGVTVVSGLARGIDGAAHQGALDADGRPTRVPMLALETDEERADFEAGKKRKEMRRRSRQ